MFAGGLVVKVTRLKLRAKEICSSVRQQYRASLLEITDRPEYEKWQMHHSAKIRSALIIFSQPFLETV